MSNNLQSVPEPVGALPAPDWRIKVYAGGEGIARRRKPAGEDQRAILIDQGGACFYCRRPFGSVVYRKGQAVWLQTQWDHFAPYAYNLRNPFDGYVAACQVCNGIKGAKVFKSKDRAIEYVRDRRFEKGYRP